jgi:hypothetical protein
MSSMNLCTNTVPTGVFHVFSYDEFNECIEESPVASPVLFDEESLVSAANMMACSDSVPPISTDGPVLLGSTVGVPFDGTPSCLSEISSPGLWYNVEGTGVPITASTCDEATTFVTKISVFSGPCSTLLCVKESDFDHVCQQGATGQTVTWVGTLGVMYHIRVHGVESEVGEFGLKVTSGWTIDFGLAVPAAKNDACAQAIGPLKTDGSLLVGSTLSASVETTCQDPARGIWYHVESGFATHGKSELSISTCSTQTQLDSTISVMTGDCDNLKCIDTIETVYCDKGSTVSWTAPPGEKYFILVHGVAQEDQGLFGLRAVEIPVVENDNCIEAMEILPTQWSCVKWNDTQCRY